MVKVVVGCSTLTGALSEARWEISRIWIFVHRCHQKYWCHQTNRPSRRDMQIQSIQHGSGAANFPHRHANSKGTLHHLSFSQFCPTFPQTSQLISSSSFTHLSLSHSPPKPPVSTEFQGIPLQSSEAALQHVRVCVCGVREMLEHGLYTHRPTGQRRTFLWCHMFCNSTQIYSNDYFPQNQRCCCYRFVSITSALVFYANVLQTGLLNFKLWILPCVDSLKTNI